MMGLEPEVSRPRKGGGVKSPRTEPLKYGGDATVVRHPRPRHRDGKRGCRLTRCGHTTWASRELPLVLEERSVMRMIDRYEPRFGEDDSAYVHRCCDTCAKALCRLGV
jgi:hypothetical protein